MAEGDTSCVCEAKYYKDKSSNCTVCPDTLNCDKEGATIETMTIVEGAWRPNTGSDNIYTCPVKEACQGGNDTSLYCVNGTGGVLCASCVEGWFRRGSLDTCQKCPSDTSLQIRLMIGLGCTAFLIAAILVAMDLKFGWTRKRGGGRLKPIVNAIQSLTVMIMFPSEWPSMVLELGKYLSFLSVDVSIAAPQCFGIAFTFYDRFMWSAAMAWALIVLPTIGAVFASLGFAVCPWMCCCGKSLPNDLRGFRTRFWAMWERAKTRGWQYSMIALLFVHPAVSGQAFFFFSCKAIMDNVKDPAVPTYYLVADYSLKCYDEDWYNLLPLAIFQVAGFAMGTPAFFMYLLRKHRVAIIEIGRQDMLDNETKQAGHEGTSLERRIVTRLGGAAVAVVAVETTNTLKAVGARLKHRFEKKRREKEGKGTDDDDRTTGEDTVGLSPPVVGGATTGARQSHEHTTEAEVDGGEATSSEAKGDGETKGDTNNTGETKGADAGETKGDVETNGDVAVAVMHANSMHGDALTGESSAGGQDASNREGGEAEGIAAVDDEPPIIRILGILTNIYLPACYFMDIVNFCTLH